MSYQKHILENLQSMDTSHEEWKAVKVTGESDGMPTFEFPEEYISAPSRYTNSSTGEMCCELCGHTIKRAFWLQHDGNSWVMLVGSECVTHFEGFSGKEIVKAVTSEQNRQLLRDAMKIDRRLCNTYCHTSRNAYYRYTTRWSNRQAEKDHYALKKTFGQTTPDGEWASPNGAITRWVKKHGNVVKDIMARHENLKETNS